MKILTAIVFAALTASSAALAGHVHKGHEDLAGNWLATFNLLSGASGCPIDVEIPARFDGGVLTGENGSGATLSAMIDAHKTIKGHFTSPEGFPDFRATYDGTRFTGTWSAIGFCDGSVTITRVAK